MKRLALAALVAASLLAGTAAPADGASRSTIARAASTLTGEATTVSCKRNLRVGGRPALGRVNYWTNAYGEVVEIADHITLDSLVCTVLAGGPDLYEGIPYIGTGESVLTLAHEAAHVRGIMNENKAECWGLRNVRRTALLLGYAYRDLAIIISQARAATTCR